VIAYWVKAALVAQEAQRFAQNGFAVRALLQTAVCQQLGHDLSTRNTWAAGQLHRD